MKGIILNLVEEAVVDRHGDDAWEAVLEKAGVEGTWTSLGTYPDEHLDRVVAAGAEYLGTDPVALTCDLGAPTLRGLARRYPDYFTPHASTADFLLTLNTVIHAEVRALQPDAGPPEFWFEPVPGPESGSRTLLVHYRSERGLCALAEGMIRGAAGHYGEDVRIDHVACTREGDAFCTLETTFWKGE